MPLGCYSEGGLSWPERTSFFPGLHSNTCPGWKSGPALTEAYFQAPGQCHDLSFGHLTSSYLIKKSSGSQCGESIWGVCADRCTHTFAYVGISELRFISCYSRVYVEAILTE